MKNILLIMAITLLSVFTGCRDKTDPSTWNDKQIDKWFEKSDWLNGWQVKPDESINRKMLAVSYFKHKDRWDKAFLFLRDHDLKTMEIKRYDIDSDNLYAPISEYYTKKDADARYEAHKTYADIQYVISGKELIGITGMDDIKEMLESYDASRDIMFMSVNTNKNSQADPGKFFIFFPDDVHRPGLRDGDSTLVRKIVVKVKLD